MPRINPIDPDSANNEVRETLNTVNSQLGCVPNIISTMAHSPAVTNAYLAFNQALAGGSLPAELREKLAIAVGETNQCSYCVSAHCAIGAQAGVESAELHAARRGQSDCSKAESALTFARQVASQRGQIGDDDIQALRDTGWNEEAIIEIIGHVGLNCFTDYFNNAIGTEIDFPEVSPINN